MKSEDEPETRNQKPETYCGEFITHSAEETFALARSIGEQLKGGEVFLLKGDLGAGKTIFAKGLAVRIAAGEDSRVTLVARACEFAAALAVLAFGLALFFAARGGG